MDKLSFNYGNIANLQKGFVCDLDSTIFASVEKFFLDAKKEAKKRSLDYMETPIKELITRFQFVERVPGWESLHPWFKEYISSPKAYKNLPFINKARESIYEIDSFYHLAGYLTARSEKTYDVTVKELAPLPKRPVLLRTEHNGMHRSQWKAKILKRLEQEGLVDGIIDDDPKLPEQLEKIAYKGWCIQFGETPNTYQARSFPHYLAKDWPSVVEILRREAPRLQKKR